MSAPCSSSSCTVSCSPEPAASVNAVSPATTKRDACTFTCSSRERADRLTGDGDALIHVAVSEEDQEDGCSEPRDMVPTVEKCSVRIYICTTRDIAFHHGAMNNLVTLVVWMQGQWYILLVASFLSATCS